ncbi:unnamed protein product [Boreogadus saida]
MEDTEPCSTAFDSLGPRRTPEHLLYCGLTRLSTGGPRARSNAPRPKEDTEPCSMRFDTPRPLEDQSPVLPLFDTICHWRTQKHVSTTLGSRAVHTVQHRGRWPRGMGRGGGTGQKLPRWSFGFFFHLVMWENVRATTAAVYGGGSPRPDPGRAWAYGAALLMTGRGGGGGGGQLWEVGVKTEYRRAPRGLRPAPPAPPGVQQQRQESATTRGVVHVADCHSGAGPGEERSRSQGKKKAAISGGRIKGVNTLCPPQGERAECQRNTESIKQCAPALAAA